MLPTLLLLCRWTDFHQLSGFRGDTECCRRDFCLRMVRDLNKASVSLADAKAIFKFGQGRINLFYWPDYSSHNPYQPMLYQHFPEHCSISPGDLDHILAEMQRQHAPEASVLHLHWTNFLLQGHISREEARVRLHAFVHKLDIFISQGGILVWTVHNALPHEMDYPDLEQELCKAVADRASIVHVHSARVPELVRPLYRIPLHKMVIAPHGNYFDVYPLTMGKVQAREELGLPRESVVFLFLGQLRAYKGLERLQIAFADFVHKHPSAHLVIAGRVNTAEADKVRQFFAHTEQSHLHLGFIPDSMIGTYLLAADYLILPYTQVLTSGSLILGQSYGLPPIVPDTGLLGEHVQDAESGYLFDPEEPEGLSKALERAMDRHREHEGLRAGALQAACNLSWKHSASVLAARISSQLCLRQI